MLYFVRKPSQGPWLTLGGDGVVAGLQPGDSPQVGPYRLVGRLGYGGMGRVFLGLSAGGRPVAVKVIRAELAADPEFRIRFGREVAAARQVSGLFTALVVDADVDGPVPWLATAYVAGPSLSDAVSSHGPMSSRSALVLAAGLAEGLSAIHAAAVVHCDLKPSNVLLSQDGPRVIDFGISRAAEAVSVTGAGLVVGSPGFMSPEQAVGDEVGPPSDVFSLGAVLAFAATGRGPFGEGSRPELAYRLVYGQPSLDPLPAELRPLVEHCLAKDPSERPTADEVLTKVAAVQAATGCLADMAIGAFAEYCLQSPVLVASRPSGPAGSPAPSAEAGQAPGAAVPPPRREPSLRRRLWRPLAVAGVAAECHRGLGRHQLRSGRRDQAPADHAAPAARGGDRCVLDAQSRIVRAPGCAIGVAEVVLVADGSPWRGPGGNRPRGGHGDVAGYVSRRLTVHVTVRVTATVPVRVRVRVPVAVQVAGPVGIAYCLPVPHHIGVRDAEPVSVHLTRPARTADHERRDIPGRRMGLF